MKALPPVAPLPPRHDAFPGPKPGVYFIDKEDVNQSNVQIVGLGVERSNPDTPAIVVMNEILGGGFGSRLFQTVRTKLGLAYAVGGGMGLEYDHPGPFDVEVLTKSASTVDAIKAADAEIAGLNSRPFTQAELTRAKDDILNSFLFRYDTREKILDEREQLEFYGYPADYLETYRAAIEKVTLADVTAAAKKYIHPGNAGDPRSGQRPANQTRLWTRSIWAHPHRLTSPFRDRQARPSPAAMQTGESRTGAHHVRALYRKGAARDFLRALRGQPVRLALHRNGASAARPAA